MSGILSLVGALFVLAGTVFLALGGLGLYRMPDVYTRIQSGTKATTMGTMLTLIGATLLAPGWAAKLLLIVLFLMFTNPLSSQVLARAAHRSGLKPVTGGAAGDEAGAVDHLAEDGEDLA